jgi:hypothetical protein
MFEECPTLTRFEAVEAFAIVPKRDLLLPTAISGRTTKALYQSYLKLLAKMFPSW